MTMNRTAIAIATAAALTFFAGPLAAETGAADPGKAPELTQGQPGGEGMGHASQMDADEVMQRYDMNNDGQLDEEELSIFGATAAGQQAEPQDPEEMMQRLDEDGDGNVSKEELKKSDMVKGQKEEGATQ